MQGVYDRKPPIETSVIRIRTEDAKAMRNLFCTESEEMSWTDIAQKLRMKFNF